MSDLEEKINDLKQQLHDARKQQANITKKKHGGKASSVIFVMLILLISLIGIGIKWRNEVVYDFYSGIFIGMMISIIIFFVSKAGMWGRKEKVDNADLSGGDCSRGYVNGGSYETSMNLPGFSI